MPIRKYLAGTVFDPATIDTMVAAFNDLKTILNVKDPNDPLGEEVAKKVVSLASRGITSRDEITRLILEESNAS